MHKSNTNQVEDIKAKPEDKPSSFQAGADDTDIMSNLQSTGSEIYIPGNTGITGGFFDNANRYVQDHLVGQANVGTASLILPRLADHNKSQMGKMVSDHPDEVSGDSLPVGPGNAYLTHLFRTHKVQEKIQKLQRKAQNFGSKIFTDQQEALRTALSAVGCFSEMNPGGLPIEIQEAKKFWFGESKPDQIEESEFHAKIQGDKKIDPKRVRKFTNHDGSLTWEILNHDKTVSTRFTMGDYMGTKVFAQGGYNKFAELLKQVQQKQGPDRGGEFDAIRNKFGGE